jgi:AraC family transcriptional regulator, regulatory protein of adaptative response / methylated-DNA-[protein]-cysteine methyltransferase
VSTIVSIWLDFAECDRARLARDPSYDGRFYTGVRTTGIYCRPVSPVRPARSTNVSFLPSAAAAEAAGFRPCLRCRPEIAPFCSAWIGSRATECSRYMSLDQSPPSAMIPSSGCPLCPA